MVRSPAFACSISLPKRRGVVLKTVLGTSGRSSTRRSCKVHSQRTEVEDEPDEKPEDIQDLLDDAEMIVEDAEPAALADLDGARRSGRKWWQPCKRARPDDGDDWHLSSR